MSQRSKHTAEWIFFAVLAVLCGVLTAVQYRWTGDLARTETARLGADFKEQVRQIGEDFDDTLAAFCGALVPAERDLRDLGVPKAHKLAWEQWRALKPQPVFARVAVAEVRSQNLVYQELNLKTGELKETSWPAEWSPLRKNLEDKLSVGSPPFSDPWGLVFEAPVFQRGRESEWVIFEIDEQHLASSWLPSLVKHRLSFEGQMLGSVRVFATSAPDKVLFKSGGASEEGDAPESVRFNRLGDITFTSRMRDPGGPGKGPPKADSGPGAPDTAFWTLEARRTQGSLEKLVSASRHRNLGIAMLLNALILAAGVLLVRHTRKSRELAQRQMHFVATVSHELRTPLTVIKGAAHNLQRGVVSDPERVSRYLEVITQNTDNLTEMVEEVLAQAGAHRSGTLRKDMVNIAGALRDALRNCEEETKAAGCVVEEHIAEDLPVVTGDAAALRRVFQNLITNAAKHATTGHWIGVEAAKRDGCIEINVNDKGPGIPAAEHRSIFEPFVRGATAQEAQTRGSGLGLSLVKDLVEAHGGTVSLRSEPGEGCTFTIKLPTA